jgi:hypothetical protein
MQLGMRASAAALAACAALLLTGCSDAYSRSTLDLRVFTSDFYKSDPGDFYGFLYSVDVTDAVCSPISDCEQAVRGEYFTWLKFSTLIAASCYVEQLGERGVQIDLFVIDFDGKRVTAEQRSEIIEVVSGFYASSPD